jgi:hypothetical protein
VSVLITRQTDEEFSYAREAIYAPVTLLAGVRWLRQEID